MQVTIDSNEPLDRVLPVINALYGVTLALPTTPEQSGAVPSRQARRSRAAQQSQAPARRNKHVEASAGAVREWARSNGHVVSDRGRVAKELVDAYRAAHRHRVCAQTRSGTALAVGIAHALSAVRKQID